MADQIQTQKSLRVEVLEQLQTLITAGFGFVSALAWNSVIQNTVQFFFPTQSEIIAQLIYALIITVVAVLVTTHLRKIINKLKGPYVK